MSASVAEAPMQAAATLEGLEPIQKIRRRWPMVLGGALTVLMIAGLVHELLGSGLVGLGRAVPVTPWFYLAFALFYLGPPTFDYVIFRRLWGIPLSGMIALHKKRISNEVLFGYSGEAYFYAWARQRTKMVAAPFGAVKDVMILSAIAGNAITLAMTAIALPYGIGLLTPAQANMLIGSIPIVFAMSLPFLLFSKKVFSLPRSTLWWVFSIHCLRIVTGMVFCAFAWHFAMPGVSIAMWLLLCTLRMFVSRLPLVPNKDLMFFGVAALIIGQRDELTQLLAFTAAITLITHVVLMAGFGLQSLLARGKEVEQAK